MFGDYEEKFDAMRLFLLYMFAHPGKKLTFMGTEFAQFREWDYQSSLEWFMLNYKNHDNMRCFVRSLNIFYLKTRELWEIDFSKEGFEWILHDDSERCVVAYRRYSIKRSSIIVIINFSNLTHEVKLSVDRSECVECVFESSYCGFDKKYKTQCDDSGYFINITIPAYSGSFLKERNNIRIIEL